jgi:drug/metabolite transporter (DMT)-like permease
VKRVVTRRATVAIGSTARRRDTGAGRSPTQSGAGRIPPLAHAATSSRLRIIAAAVLFSTGGAGIKACGLTAEQLAGARAAAAALTLLLLLRPRPARAYVGWPALALGVAYAATMIIFVLGNKLTTAASTIFLQSTAPLYILLLGPLLLGERLQRRDLWFMATLAVGLAMFFVGAPPASASAPNPVRGNFIAACGGLSWGLTIVGMRWMGRRHAIHAGAGNAALVTGNVLVFLVCLPLAWPLAGSPLTDWLIVTYLGVFQIGLPYALMTSGFRHVSALEASLLLLVEPVLNPVWAWLLHGEQPGAWSLTGGTLILGASAWQTWTSRSRAFTAETSR